MRRTVFFIISLFLACGAARAQSLGELARLEQERRNSIRDNADDHYPTKNTENKVGDDAQGFVEGAVAAVDAHVNPNYKFLNRCKVSRVVDGDTLRVDCLSESIRLIGVNTPENAKPNVQCYGAEASDYTRQRLEGKYIYLESDPTQGDFDQYHRLLRYVYTEDGDNFNMRLVADGYAHEYTYNAPYKYQAQFMEAQDSAYARRAGLWSYATCGGQTGKMVASRDPEGDLLFTTPAPPTPRKDRKTTAKAATASCGPEYWYDRNHCVQIPMTGELLYECTRPDGSKYNHTCAKSTSR